MATRMSVNGKMIKEKGKVWNIIPMDAFVIKDRLLKTHITDMALCTKMMERLSIKENGFMVAITIKVLASDESRF